MGKRVVILGGGVAGLSAAHELVKRGYEVEVYEARRDLGGKARSQPLAGTGTNGRRDLPGEHGFRFYPAFYKHLIQTMSEIPLEGAANGGRTVADNLRPCAEAGIGMEGVGLVEFLRQKPSAAFDIARMLGDVLREAPRRYARHGAVRREDPALYELVPRSAR